MKKLVVALALLSLAAVAAAAEYPVSFIGLSADEELNVCYGDVQVNAMNTVYVVAYLRPEISGVRGAEFRIDGLPANAVPPYAVFQSSWNGSTAGDLGTSFGVGLQYPQPGPLVVLGVIQWYIMDPYWLGADHVLSVQQTTDTERLMIMDLSNVEQTIFGGQFTFNCSNPEDCGCRDGDSTALEQTSWSSVKALY